MYLPTFMGDRVIYFKNILSEPEKIITLIENFNDDKEVYGYLSEWQKQNDNVYIKEFLKKENDINIKKIQKLDYIYNSFYRGILFAREHYLNAAMREADQIEDIKIVKCLPTEENSEIFIESDSENIFFYIIINSELESHPACINKQNNIYIVPEPNTALMIPGDIKHSIGNNKKEPLYYVTGKFKLTTERKNRIELF